MDEETALVDKVLTELNQIIETEPNLNGFEIIPIVDNNRNTSPLLFENNSIGLEMWCVKHIIINTNVYLMKMRKNIRKKLSEDEVVKLKRYLTGAVLIRPEVTTYWNMRKELIEAGHLTSQLELDFTKLVLSYKNKCNEAFAQRRWILARALEERSGNSCLHLPTVIIMNELEVAEMTSIITKNNYHAWAHRIWVLKYATRLSKLSLSDVLSSQYERSYDWSFSNVSEHSAFHYRQKLIELLVENREKILDFFTRFKEFVSNYFNLDQFEFDDSKCLFSLLIYELFHTIKELNNSYPGHESVWYHRRFVVKTLLDCVSNLSDKVNLKINDVGLAKSENILNHSKVFKPDLTGSDDIVYNLIIKHETAVIGNCRSLKSNTVQRELAERHEKWLRSVLGVTLAI